MTERHDFLQEQIVLSLCVHLSCFAQQVAQTIYEVSLIWRIKFFVQIFLIDLVRTGRFTLNNKHIFCILRFPPIDYRLVWVLVGLGWRTLLVELLHKTVERVYRLAVRWTVEPNSFPLVQSWSCRNEIFGGVSRRHVWLLIQNFSSLQSHNFWNTISWKCSLEDNCIRSSLIDCQSLFHRKINIDPKYRVLMFLPCTVQVSCSSWYREINMFRIFMIFVSWINGQEEYCLVSCLNPDLQVSIHCWWLNED